MSREKQIEEISCNRCVHYEVCMYVNAQAVEYARAENCKLFRDTAGYRKQSEGEWENVYNHDTCDGHLQRKTTCSVCGYKPKNDICGKTPYCPNCGAKMKGGE